MSLGPIFLSASVPYRQPDTYIPDPTAVRDAVRALVAVVVPTRILVFGGHPAISPLVWEAASSLGSSENVYIYQSEMFLRHIPPQARFFGRLIWTPAYRSQPPDPNNPFDRERSLAEMRKWMIEDQRVPPDHPPLSPFDAGVFIGGMDGVEQEWELFTRHHPHALALPVASTEGAARRIFDDRGLTGHITPRMRGLLAEELNYRKLFHELLPP